MEAHGACAAQHRRLLPALLAVGEDAHAYRPCEPPAALPGAGAAAGGAGGFRGFASRGNGTVCKFDPSEVWKCCFMRAPEDK